MSGFDQPLGGNDMPHVGGLTVMMRPPVPDTAEDLDACLVRIPLDNGSSSRPGTRLGPRQIRDEHRMLRPYNIATGRRPPPSSPRGTSTMIAHTGGRRPSRPRIP